MKARYSFLPSRKNNDLISSSINKSNMIFVMIITGQSKIYVRVSAKYNSLPKYLFSQNSQLYAELLCFVNRVLAFEPNPGIKSANARTCVSGIMSPKGAPPARVACLRTNIALAGSRKSPALEENIGLTCGTISNHCMYVRKTSEIGFGANPFEGTTCMMSFSWATECPFI